MNAREIAAVERDLSSSVGTVNDQRVGQVQIAYGAGAKQERHSVRVPFLLKCEHSPEVAEEESEEIDGVNSEIE